MKASWMNMDEPDRGKVKRSNCAVVTRGPRWCRRQESNLYLALRRHSFYPLNYGDSERRFYRAIFEALSRCKSLTVKAIDQCQVAF